MFAIKGDVDSARDVSFSNKNVNWRLVHLPCLVTTSQDSFLYYLSVWKIFSKNSLSMPSQVALIAFPLESGCKGRHFYINCQTLEQLFYRKKSRKITKRWFINKTKKPEFYTKQQKWHSYVAKHGSDQKWTELNYLKKQTGKAIYKEKLRQGRKPQGSIAQERHNRH